MKEVAMRKRAWWAVVASGVLVGVLLTGWACAAAEGQFTSLTVEELLAIRADVETALRESGRATAGLVLGFGADAVLLGGSMVIQRTAGMLAPGFTVSERELRRGEPESLWSGLHCYLVTAFAEEPGGGGGSRVTILEEIQAGPVIVEWRRDRRLALSWKVPDALRSAARLGLPVGYRVYRAGFRDGEDENCARLPLDRYGLVKEVRLTGEEREIVFEDDGRGTLGRAPALREGARLAVEGTTVLGRAGDSARLNIAPKSESGSPPLLVSFDGAEVGAGSWAWAMAAGPIALGSPTGLSPRTELALIETFAGGGVPRLTFSGPRGDVAIELGNPVTGAGGSFSVNQVGVGVPRFQINPAGNVGIGVAAPAAGPAGSVHVAGNVGIGVAAPVGVPPGSIAIAGNVGIGAPPGPTTRLTIQASAAPPIPASILLDSTSLVGGRQWDLISTAAGDFVLQDALRGQPRIQVTGPVARVTVSLGDPTPPLGPATHGTFTVKDLGLQPGGATRLELGIGGTNARLSIGAPSIPAGPGQPFVPSAPGTFALEDISAPAAGPRLFVATTGDVGLATNTPTSRLHVSGLAPAVAPPSGRAADLALDSSGIPGGLKWVITSKVGLPKVPAALVIETSTMPNQMVLTDEWNVGLATNTPTSRLDISAILPGRPADLALDSSRIGGTRWVVTSTAAGSLEIAAAAGAGGFCTGGPYFAISNAGAAALGAAPPAAPAGSLTVAHSLGVGQAAPGACGDIALAGNLLVGRNTLVGAQLRLGNFAEAPAALGSGALYYDTSKGLPYYYDGAAWRSLVGPQGPAGPAGAGIADVQLRVAPLPAGANPTGSAALIPTPSPTNQTLVLTLGIPRGDDGAPGPGIADVELRVRYVKPGQTTQESTATLVPIPGREDRKLLLDLVIPEPAPATVDTAISDRRYVQKAGDTMTGTLKLPELESTGQVFGDWLVVGEPGFTNCWSFINPDSGPNLALGTAEGADLSTLKLTVMEFDRASGRVRIPSGLSVDSLTSARWLVLGGVGDSLANTWGIVKQPGLGAGTLTLGVFATHDEATNARLHVPVMSFTSTEVTVIQDATFSRDVNVEGELRVLGPLDAGDVRGGDAVFDNVTVSRDLTVRGCKFFVQPHPDDPSLEISYAALEGPEAGTYVRGVAQLRNGEATIELPEHFALVTSDEGLTVQLTPRGEWLQLYVLDLSTARIVVREAAGKSGEFYFLVQGVRRGYEDLTATRNRQGGQ